MRPPPGLHCISASLFPRLKTAVYGDPWFGGRISEVKLRSLSLLRLSFCAWEECGRAAGPCSPRQPPWALSWDEAGHDLPLGVNIASSRRMDFRGKGPSCRLCVKAGRRLKDKTALTSAYLPRPAPACPDPLLPALPDSCIARVHSDCSAP